MYIKKYSSKLLEYKLIRFLLAGGVGGILAYFLLYFFTDYLIIPLAISSLISQYIGYLINFFTNKFWAFENKNLKKTSWQGPVFLIKAALFSSANTKALVFLVEEYAVPYMLVQLIIMIPITGLSFFISWLIFKNKKETKTPNN